ncbi:hypothetical protein B7494_g1739 [Chlorociboria aeruginascens]|nr:hypothetical protein B7494_g1739 [Chlorociboria aeruginascens]
MAYPPPPGLESSSSAHHSLPARPPPTTSTFNHAPPRSNSNNFSGFAPRQVSAPQNNYQQPSYQSSYPPYDQQAAEPAYGAAPQIRNPFAPPTQNATSNPYAPEDPEMAAQIAQWQSAYAGKDNSSGYTGPVRRHPSTYESSGAATSANASPLGGGSWDNSNLHKEAHTDTGVATVVSDSKTNTKTVVRTGGGTQWTDSSLLEWDPSHFRLFVGNLAGEVTDDSLYKAFSRWGSVQKARVVRDKRTDKSKGYGFVSFTDGDEFFKAAREMQGKYIGSHPVIVKRSTTEIKAVTPKDHKKGKGNKNRGKGDKGSGDKVKDGGIKKGDKTKGGLKVLG